MTIDQGEPQRSVLIDARALSSCRHRLRLETANPAAALAAPEAWTLLDGAFDDANEDLATFVRLARETASLPGSWASWDTGEAT